MDSLYLIIFRNNGHGPGKYDSRICKLPETQRELVARLRSRGFKVKAWKINIPDYPELQI